MAGDMAKKYTTGTFMCELFSITRDDQVQKTIDLMMEQISAKIERFQKDGSGWILDRIEETFINVA
eukprot:7102-Eustigmatos_ZCMA.PRE.1